MKQVRHSSGKLGILRKALQPAIAMTEQEIFDKAAAHLLEQGKRARENGKCCYRTSGSGTVLKCAVGALIPDELYDPLLEGLPAIWGFPDGGGESELRRKVALLESLQIVHDQFHEDSWKDELTKLAKAVGLSTKVLENAENGIATADHQAGT